MCKLGNFEKTDHIAKKDALLVYRWFSLTAGRDGKMRLKPLTNRHPRTWLKRQAKANKSPGSNDMFGLYGFFTKEDAMRQPDGDVLGLISVHGDVAFHEDGIRASRARVEALYPTDTNRKITIPGSYSFATGTYKNTSFRKALKKSAMKFVHLTRLNASKIHKKINGNF